MSDQGYRWVGALEPVITVGVDELLVVAGKGGDRFGVGESVKQREA